MVEGPKIMRFTMNRIDALTCPAGKKDALYFDDELPGFGVRVSSGGGKTYLCQYRTAAGVRRMAIGKCSVVSLDAARKAARAILGKAASGHDPVSDRRAKEKEARQKKVEDEFTLDALIAAWAADRIENCRASYLKIATAALRTHLQGLLAVPAAQVTVDDALAALNHVKAAKRGDKETKGVAANRLLSYGRACFGWAVRRQDGQYKKLTVNPFGDIARPVREKSRDRVLTDTEIGAIWRAADHVDWPAGQFTKILMLTLARRDEVASMRWSEICADGTVWTLPAERAKNGKAHMVHLSEPARAILGSLPRLGTDFVFCTTGKSPISGFSGFKKIIDRAAAADLGASIADWRFHDFRRAGVTWMADAGFPPHVADRILNHTAGVISGVAATYQRGEFLKERKTLLDAWASYVISAAAGVAVPDNVVALRA
jgi:integrase